MENIQKKRNGEIELLRILFCLAVVGTHLNAYFKPEMFKEGVFAVEFFFLVSGYFMAKSAERAESLTFGDTMSFLSRKFKSFFPYYIVSVLIYFIVYRVILLHISLSETITGALYLIPEMMFLQMGGFATESVLNIPAVWYLSAMMISMLVLYPIAVRFRKSYGIIFLIGAIFGLGYLIRLHGGYIAVFRTTDAGLLYDGMLRGLCETALGAFCYQFSMFIKRDISKLKKILLTAVKYACYIVTLVFVFSNFGNKYQPVVLVILTCAFILTTSEIAYNIPYCKFVAFCGRFSLPLYLFHSVVFRCIYIYIQKKGANGRHRRQMC